MTRGLIETIAGNIERYAHRNAFVIQDTSFTYSEFGQKISNIRRAIRLLPTQKNEIVGVETYNDIETYATIFALWFEGLCFVPINPLLPASRNEAIQKQTSIRYLFSGRDQSATLSESAVVNCSTANLVDEPMLKELPAFGDDDLMYILFTSGSTGVPKGVPISRRNLSAFIDGFYANGYGISESDRFLQMFDFTFDVSVKCYVAPLVCGASVCTVPLDGIKFLSIFQILEKYKVTIAEMVPSVIAFLRPYFRRIHLPELRLCIFTGEALYDEVVNEWAPCAPNAIIENYYGPTEATVGCLYYRWEPGQRSAKTYNGIVSVGKPFGTTETTIIGDDNLPVAPGQKGELCVAGEQITPGYWLLPDKNISAFVWLNTNGGMVRYYRTGDLAFYDADGDIMYCGRIDDQVQVQGFRVELGELEHCCKQIAGSIQVAAIAKELGNGNTLLYLFVENYGQEMDTLWQYLKHELPFYMHPTEIVNVEKFPLTTSGKIDKKTLLAKLM